MPNRLIAFADIHGMAEKLRRLLDLLDPTTGDEFVSLGDSINRGPNSNQVVDRLIELALSFSLSPIMGNHEEMLLAATLGKAEFGYWMKFGGMATLRSYGIPASLRPAHKFDLHLLPPNHARFFGSLLDYHETDTHIFLHAGCHPDRKMKEQTGSDLRWGTAVAHHSGKTVVCGHVPGAHVIYDPGVIRLDTGCGVWPHGKLTALDVLSGQTWSV